MRIPSMPCALLASALTTTLLAVAGPAATASPHRTSPVTAGPVRATAVDHDRLVSTQPSQATPNVKDGAVAAILDTGSTIVVGGSFSSVSNPGSSGVQPRSYLLAFDKATGRVDTAFTPQLNNAVTSLLPGPTAGTVYVGGRFNTVNGVARKGVALLQLADGALVTSFQPPYLNGIVEDMAATAGRLLMTGTFTTVGGQARHGLASLTATTGALDSYLTVPLTEHHNYDGTGANGAVGGKAMALSLDAATLIVIGNFKKAGGVLHDQIVRLDLGPGAATIANWNTNGFTAACQRTSFDSWVRDIAYSPDGGYFVVVTTGAGFAGTLCDSATRWETASAGTDVQPTWIAYTGGDTLLSVEVTGQAVYVGGHQRWMNNSLARDTAGAGAVGRASLAALDPATGLPYPWNPGRNPRGVGVGALYATADGLWLGHDTDYLGNFQYWRQRIGFFPLAGGVPVADPVPSVLPGNVYLAGLDLGNDLRVRGYDGGTGVGATTTVAGAGGGWSGARGAFHLSGALYYGMSDGYLYRVPFDGAAVGSRMLLDPYHDNDGVAPDWDDVGTGSGQTFAGVYPSLFGSELANVTGMFYSAGRIYYTLAGQTAMYWRWFQPDGGVVGADRFTLPVSGFADVAGGLFVHGGKLYFSRVNSNLYTMPFVGGAPAGSAVAISGPLIDGQRWRSRAAFIGPA